MNTLVIGLGNPILGDDGVGLAVARAVDSALSECDMPETEVAEACVGGLRLMEMMVGHERVILVDAIKTHDGKTGTVYRLCLDDLRALGPTQHSASAHDAGLPTSLAAGRQMGLDLPEELVIYAIEVLHVSDFGYAMCDEVAGAIPAVAAAIMADLREWQSCMSLA